MPTPPIPPVLRSLQHQKGVLGLVADDTLPIVELATTYTMVQELTWLDTNHFAIGRWDGSLGVFNFETAPNQGPLISNIVSSPAQEGVQMITLVARNLVITSNDNQSMILWSSASGQWTDLSAVQRLSYSSALGVANSGVCFTNTAGTQLYLVVGHETGFLTIWVGTVDGFSLTLQQTVDLRSSTPVNPWNLHNIRGVALVENDVSGGCVVTGSEDGDLCVVRIPDGTLLSRTVYNPAAQRGINSIATQGQQLLVANCSVGSTDKNLWYYQINTGDWSIALVGALNLQVDPAAQQVFNFDVIWGSYSGGQCWYASTEEGYLWMGSAAQSLSVIARQSITAPLGSAIGLSSQGYLACASNNIYQFNTNSSGTHA